MGKTGYSKSELDGAYYTGFAEGVKMLSENILNSIEADMENGTIRIEKGKDRLFEIINSINKK